ncbi:hypothetical protein [Priestia megaterium]|uniref:hypothetical protein n=1 Tax=Priestia megaterium TaxID=1404 RepID=UPI002079EBAA|nr:hypothetical protein [Priestia megaterium]USL31379.1 hypothetical protein LIT30_03945 [Priestia megaterium]
MTQLLEMNNAIEEIDVQEKLYPVCENWDLLKPYLNDEDVQEVLNEAMIDFCLEHPNRAPKMWEPGDAPWEYTTRDHWVMAIEEKIAEDEQYHAEFKALDKEWISKTGQEEDHLWDNDDYRKQWSLLHEKYYKKHSPKEGTREWYQFFGGCHWINQFTAALVSKALNVEAFVYETTTHTCATFVKDDVVYYADVQLDWENLQELIDFMGEGEEVNFYPVFDEIL